MYLRKLATLLHAHFCRLDHTDRCDWYYEKDSWKGNTWGYAEHRRWLKIAEMVIKRSKLTTVEIIKILEHIINIEKTIYDINKLLVLSFRKRKTN